MSIRLAQMQQTPQMAKMRAPLSPPTVMPQEPGIAGQFAGKVAEKAAAQQLAETGLAESGLLGSVAAGMAPAFAGKLAGGWFNQGGAIADQLRSKGLSEDDIAHYMANYQKHVDKYGVGTRYKNIGGLTKGPLGMSDMLMAGKGKDVSKVTYKKKGGEVEDVVEIAYHAPLAAKPSE